MKKRAKDKKAFGITAEAQVTAQVSVAPDVEKQYFEILNYLTKQRDNLLGEFLSDGGYKISDEKILQELLLIPKKFEEKVDNAVYASAKINSVILNFKIDLDISESFCNAKLSLIEIEHDIEKDIKHVTVLAETIEPYSPKFKENVYKLWKVYIDENPYDKNDYLDTYLRLQQEEFLFNRELLDILSQLYIMKMFKILAESGELGAKIKEKYQKLYEKFLAKDPAVAQDNTFMKRLLDSVIISENAFKDILKHKDAATVLNGFAMPIRKIKDKTNTAEVETMQKEEKKDDKTSAKKKDDKKPAKAKAKSGGGKAKPYKFDPSKAFGTKYGGGVTMPKVGFTFASQAQTKPMQTKPEQKTPEKTEPVKPVEKPVEKPNPKTEEEMLREYMAELKKVAETGKKVEGAINDSIKERESNMVDNKSTNIVKKKDDSSLSL